MKGVITALVLGALSLVAVASDDGMISVKSSHDVDATVDRLVAALQTKGFNVFARIDHRAGAAKVGKQLRPTKLVIFGNPKAGTPVMQCSQTAALDLPQKALIWEDAEGQVWLTYNDPQYVAGRHDVGECGGVIAKMEKGLANFARVATQPDA